MKRISILLTLTCTAFTAMAQTNIFPGSGNAGIGTTSPGHLLTIKGDHYNTRMEFQYDPFGTGLQAANLFLWASEPGISYTGTGIGNNTYNGAIGITRKFTSRGGSYVRLLDQQIMMHVVDINGVDKPAVFVDQSGNVGLGMDGAFEKLTVNGNIKSYSPYGAGLVPAASWIGAHTANSNGTVVAFGGMKIEYGRLSDADFSSTLKFYTARDNNTEERMSIDNIGNVAIGTNTQADYKLAVNGTVGARKVKVTQETWADHVFENEYKLPTLAELDNYIIKHRRLPGIPSANEVKAEGLDIGDMQAKLLEKIEELTLYLIEERKRNDALEHRVKSLEKGAK